MQRVESETDAGLLGFAGNLRQDGDRKRRRPQPSHDVASGPVGVLHGHNAISTPRKVHPLAMSNQSPSGPDSFRIPRPKARGRVSSSPYPPRRRGSSRSAAAGAAAVAGAGGQSDMGTMFFVFLPSLAGQVDHHGHGLVGAADLGGSPDVPSTPMVFTPTHPVWLLDQRLRRGLHGVPGVPGTPRCRAIAETVVSSWRSASTAQSTARVLSLARRRGEGVVLNPRPTCTARLRTTAPGRWPSGRSSASRSPGLRGVVGARSDLRPCTGQNPADRLDPEPLAAGPPRSWYRSVLLVDSAWATQPCSVSGFTPSCSPTRRYARTSRQVAPSVERHPDRRLPKLLRIVPRCCVTLVLSWK